ncbi:MAG: ABC transporter permease [Pseudomonadales bacterium]
MFAYYLTNAIRSMRRNPALTLLVVAAIAVGIAVSMTMLTVYYVMASNPIPRKSEQLFAVQLDSWNPLRPFDSDRPERPPHQMTWRDVNALLEAGYASRQAGMFEAELVITPQGENQLPFEVSARVTSSDFFPMFEPSFRYGGGWDRQADRVSAQVMVINRKINDRLFGGEDSVGRRVTVNGREFTITGVMDQWEPMPRFYDVIEGGLDEVSEVFVPLSLTPRMKFNSAGSDWGWKPEPIRSFEDWLNSEAVWLQFWAELPTPEDKAAYQAHIDAYVMEQKKLGRFERPLNNQLHDVMEWMAYHEIVQKDVRVLVGLGFLFLVVCLLSSVSLLLTKFEGRSGEMSLRRALGANKTQVISQNLIEVAVIGTCGGAIGITLTWASLNALGAAITRAPQALFEIDTTMIVTAIAVSVCTSLLAGIYPAVKTCAIAPAQQLKTQ